MQWHPLFAHLLRPMLQGHYDVQTNVPVGDLPRQADIVLLRRTSAGPMPFQSIWRHLTPWNVLEFKGPTVDPRQHDPDLLIEVGLGVERRLAERRKNQPGSGRAAVSYWYVANHLGRRFLAQVERVVGQRPTPVLDGLWRSPCLGRSMFLVSNDALPVDAETVPLHLVSHESTERQQQLARTVASEASLWQTYGPWLLYFHPTMGEEVERMAKAARKKKGEFRPDIRPLAEMMGLKNVIRQLGLKQVIEEVLPELTVEQLVAGLTVEQREELKRLLR